VGEIADQRPTREIGTAAGLGLVALAPVLLTLALRGPLDPWTGMTAAMGLLMAACLAFRAVRARLRPTPGRIALGLAAGAALYGLTLVGIRLLQALWPSWEGQARELSSWKGGHSPAFLAATLVLIVAAEEIFWRGVVLKFLAERLGVAPGILVGALAYAAAHLAAANPLLIGAALGCGLYWGLAAAITDDLTAPIVSHLAWDVLILFVAPPF
jgi:membrane protease YdiL (CAAX protease family)